MNKLLNRGKTLLNALAFANVGNLSEFEALLDQVAPAAHALPAKQAEMPKHTAVEPILPQWHQAA